VFPKSILFILLVSSARLLGSSSPHILLSTHNTYHTNTPCPSCNSKHLTQKAGRGQTTITLNQHNSELYGQPSPFVIFLINTIKTSLCQTDADGRNTSRKLSFGRFPGKLQHYKTNFFDNYRKIGLFIE